MAEVKCLILAPVGKNTAGKNCGPDSCFWRIQNRYNQHNEYLSGGIFSIYRFSGMQFVMCEYDPDGYWEDGRTFSYTGFESDL
jgi:hypothetical protein